MKSALQVLCLIALVHLVDSLLEGPPRLRLPGKHYLAWPVGGQIKLKCKPEGGATPLKIRWYKDGKIVRNTAGAPVPSQRDDERWQLRFKVKLADSGTYACVVSNQYGTAKRTFKIKVVAKPQSGPVLMPDYPKPVTAREGDNVRLECLERPSNALSDYRWLKSPTLPTKDEIKNNKNGSVVILEPAKYRSITKDIGGKKLYGGMLHLDHVSKKDEGFYTCFLMNNFGATYRSAYVTVQQVSPTDPPEFIIPKERRRRLYFGTEGDDVTLSCLVRGGAPMIYQWFYKGQRLGSDARHVLNNSQLVVKDVRRSDVGVYTCTIKNAYGRIKHHFKLHVHRRKRTAPLLLPGYPQDKTASVGETVLLHCTETGPKDLIVNYRWIKWHDNRRRIVEADFMNSSLYSLVSPQHHQSSTKVYTFSKTKVISLKLERLAPKDEGLYTCFVSNAVGHSFQSAYLTVDNSAENKIDDNPATAVNPTTRKEQQTVQCHEYRGRLDTNAASAGKCNTTTYCGQIYDEGLDHWRTFCDQKQLCEKHGVTAGTCAQMTMEGREMELCCCKEELCNIPTIKLFRRGKKSSGKGSNKSSQLTTFIFLIVLLLTIVMMLVLLIYRLKRRRAALQAQTRIVHNTRKNHKLTKRMIMETKWLKEDNV